MRDARTMRGYVWDMSGKASTPDMGARMVRGYVWDMSGKASIPDMGLTRKS
jgi:hypothetical protein